jgi:hypothetical protein
LRIANPVFEIRADPGKEISSKADSAMGGAPREFPSGAAIPS